MRAVLQEERHVREQRMFGGICWMLHGKMLCGVEVGRYMFRVGKEQLEEALSRPGAAPIIFGGRTMVGFVWVGATYCNADGLRRWIDLAKAHVLSLSPK